MKDLVPTRGKTRYVRSLIQEGEHEHQDFKHSVSDPAKIARSLSAFANHDGGSLLVGVRDNGTICGVRSVEDAYVIDRAATEYCRPAVEVQHEVYSIDTGLTVLRTTVSASLRRPVQALDPADGSWHAYYRVADENILAHPLMVAAWRRAQASRPVVLSDCVHAGVLGAVATAGAEGCDPEAVAVLAGFSRATTERALADLAAMRLVTFDYLPSRQWTVHNS